MPLHKDTIELTINRLQRQIKKKHDLAEKYHKLWSEDSSELMKINCVLRQVTGKNWHEMVQDGTVRELIRKYFAVEAEDVGT